MGGAGGGGPEGMEIRAVADDLLAVAKTNTALESSYPPIKDAISGLGLVASLCLIIFTH